MPRDPERFAQLNVYLSIGWKAVFDEIKAAEEEAADGYELKPRQVMETILREAAEARGISIPKDVRVERKNAAGSKAPGRGRRGVR